MDSDAVSLRACRDYGQDNVDSALGLCLSDLGGMEQFVKKGETTVLKVNLLRAARPEEAITTHPAVVLALSREVERAGGMPVVADSPGGRFTEGRLRRVYERTGLLELEKRGEIHLNWDLSSARVSFPEGKILRSVDVLKVVKGADGVITVPKLKTHTQTIITGAIKILYGVIPGLAKTGYHAKLPGRDDFNQMLLDILCIVNPRLSVMDGILGMEGNGPSVGTPRWGRVLLAGANSAAVDVAAAMFMGLAPERVPLLKAAMERRLVIPPPPEGGGVSRISLRPIPPRAKALGVPAKFVMRDATGLHLLGDPLENVRSGDWKIPVSRVGVMEYLADRVPPKVLRRMGTLLIRRPVPDRTRCTACGECVHNCPRQCMRIRNDRLTIDYGRCISCFCCAETCPNKAINVKEPILSRGKR